MEVLVLIIFGICIQSASKFMVLAGNPPSSISSLDWQYKQVEIKLRNYEERIKKTIPTVQYQINVTIAAMGTDFPGIVVVLNSAYKTLDNLASANTYGNVTIDNITCNDIGLRINSIVNDNIRLSKISCEAAVNQSVVITQQAYVQGVAAQYNYQLNLTRRHALANCSNSLSVLSDQYFNYVVQVTNGIVIYNVLYAELLIWKNQYCTDCPTRFTVNDTKKLSTIDDDINQIEMALNEVEEVIRTTSADTITKVNSVNPSFKKDVVLYNLAVSLDSAANLVQGYLQLDTLEFVNETADCDDNNWKIAVVQYKMSLYMQMIVESAVNSSYVISNNALIQVYYSIDKNILTKSQKQTVSDVITNLDLIAEYYRQYILSCVVAFGKLFSVVQDLMLIQGTACTCTPGATSEYISIFWISVTDLLIYTNKLCIIL